jgi:type IV pilus assembly protein PilV
MLEPAADMFWNETMAPFVLPAPNRNAPAVSRRQCEAGFSMLEVMISVFIILLGLLGLAGLIVRSNQAEMESYQRVQAVMLVQDMADRINANRKVASCYSKAGAGIVLGKDSTDTSPACTVGTDPQQQARAVADLIAWHNLLIGSAELSGTSKIGAMIDARGCVDYDATTEVAGAGTGVYTVSVVWQGLASTSSSANTCGKGDYDAADTQRRVVTATVRIGGLS